MAKASKKATKRKVARTAKRKDAKMSKKPRNAHQDDDEPTHQPVPPPDPKPEPPPEPLPAAKQTMTWVGPQEFKEWAGIRYKKDEAVDLSSVPHFRRKQMQSEVLGNANWKMEGDPL